MILASSSASLHTKYMHIYAGQIADSTVHNMFIQPRGKSLVVFDILSAEGLSWISFQMRRFNRIILRVMRFAPSCRTCLLYHCRCGCCTAGVTRTLRDAQREILTFVDAKTYLVGHSLDSDLRALRLVHRRLIDTSELYPSPRGMPFKVPRLVGVRLTLHPVHPPQTNPEMLPPALYDTRCENLREFMSAVGGHEWNSRRVRCVSLIPPPPPTLDRFSLPRSSPSRLAFSLQFRPIVGTIPDVSCSPGDCPMSAL